LRKHLARAFIVSFSAILPILLALAAFPSGIAYVGASNQNLSPAPLFTTTLTPSAPTLATIAGESAIKITYTSNLNESSSFVVFGVFHNSANQVVYITTASVTILEGGNQTAYLITAPLSQGTYHATIFAVTTGDVVVSPSSTMEVQIA
jgi:hypothetical protein